MLIRNECVAAGCMLGIWKMEESAGELLRLFPESLRNRAASHVANIRSGKRVAEWLSTRLLLLRMLDEDKIIHHSRSGRPFLTDDSYRISISHTTNYAAVLAHPSQRVGIDVEFRSGKIGKIASKFISAEEYVDDSQRLLHETLIWSAKETMFKIIDEGEIDFCQHLHIHRFVPREEGVMRATETKTGGNRSFDIRYEVFPDYVLTWTME